MKLLAADNVNDTYHPLFNAARTPKRTRLSRSALLSREEVIAALRAALCRPELSPKQWQLEAAYRLLQGADGVVAAGTGSGKSLFWWIAALAMSEACFVVIEPIPAWLLNKYAAKLKAAGIDAVAINKESMKHGSETTESNVLASVKSGQTRFIFVSPEMMLLNEAVNRAVCESKWSKNVRAIIFDETHIVYDWGIKPSKNSGAAFRPEYGKAAILRARFRGDIPVLALSATLCGPCLLAIVKALGFGRLPFFCLDAERQQDRCSYDIQAIRHPLRGMRGLAETLPSNPSTVDDLPRSLIFVNTKAETRQGLRSLRSILPPSLRDAVQRVTGDDSASRVQEILRQFREGSVRVIVCTEALGMGVDLPNIDLVIQWRLPRDFKDLVQHFGRAARTPGAKAHVLLLYDDWTERVAHAGATTSTLQARWNKIDPLLREWLSPKRCKRKALDELLALDFKALESIIADGTSSTSVSTDISDLCRTQPHFFFWHG
ncbi:hypothetical protein V8E36_004586 [Tilletia maclaganii]